MMETEVSKKVKSKPVKEFLYWNESEYTRHLKMDKELFGLLDNMLLEVRNSLKEGFEVDYIELLEDPSSYIVEQYFKLHGNGKDVKHAQRICVSQTGLENEALHRTHKRFDALVISLGQYAPTVTRTGIKTNVIKTSWNKYLDENKRELYDKVKAFLEAAKILEPSLSYPIPFRLSQWGAPYIVMDQIEPTINYLLFEE